MQSHSNVIMTSQYASIATITPQSYSLLIVTYNSEMVFTKKSRGDLKTRFKRGHVDPMKGKTFKIFGKMSISLLNGFSRRKPKLFHPNSSTLLWPNENKIPEVEKCDSKSVG